MNENYGTHSARSGGFTARQLIFVQLQTDAGISGIGEASQSGNDALVLSALSSDEELRVGCDPTQLEVLWERMVRSGGIFRRRGARRGTAISAVDQALWDIAGKALDVPVWRLLGGSAGIEYAYMPI